MVVLWFVDIDVIVYVVNLNYVIILLVIWIRVKEVVGDVFYDDV